MYYEYCDKAGKKEMANKVFDADNSFNRTLYKIGSMILLNIYFIIGCIPVVTVGTSITASISVLFKFKENPDMKITSTFFKAYKSNLIDTVLIWIILAGISSASFMMVMAIVTGVAGLTGALGIAVMVIFGIIFLICLMIFTFVFVLIARYENFILMQIKNALKVAVAHLFWCLLIWIVWCIAVVPFTFWPQLFIYMGWVWLAFGFALVMNISMNIYIRILRKFENHED